MATPGSTPKPAASCQRSAPCSMLKRARRWPRCSPSTRRSPLLVDPVDRGRALINRGAVFLQQRQVPRRRRATSPRAALLETEAASRRGRDGAAQPRLRRSTRGRPRRAPSPTWTGPGPCSPAIARWATPSANQDRAEVLMAAGLPSRGVADARGGRPRLRRRRMLAEPGRGGAGAGSDARDRSRRRRRSASRAGRLTGSVGEAPRRGGLARRRCGSPPRSTWAAPPPPSWPGVSSCSPVLAG